MDFSPLISVYITTQNRPKLLERALESLSNQTYNNFEVLICDDASDSTHIVEYNRIKTKYEFIFNRFIFIRNEFKKGACFSRNKLINLAAGEYITGLDDDDAFHPQRLALFVNFQKVNSDFSFLCSGVNRIENSETIPIDNFSGHIIDFEMMKNLNFVGNQIFVKKSIIESAGCFDVNMPAWQDYDTWFRIIKKFGPAFKLNAMTMLLDSSEGRVRITTSSNAHRGYIQFIEKHRVDLSADNLLSLKYSDLINRKQKFTVINLELLRRFKLMKRVIKYKSVYDFPRLYNLYQRFLKK